MIEIREYLDENDRSPYAKWFDNLSAQAAAKVAVAVTRMEQGNFSNAKGVGGGVLEYVVDFGPGYRVYFGKDGERLDRIAFGPDQKFIRPKCVNPI